MSVHPALDRLLLSMPWLSVVRASMTQQARYYPEHQAILVRHGLRGPRYTSTVTHEALHAQRGDAPCASPVSEAQQEERTNRDAARLLIEIHDLGEIAAQYPDDAHRIADELGVDYDTLACRMKHLHPAERGYLKRRLEHTEESA
jgi:hypothetical protein